MRAAPRLGQPGWVSRPGSCAVLLPPSRFGLLAVSATSADAGTSFHMQTPEPGPHPEGDTAQKVHIKSSWLEDATIGNSNKMTIRTASQGEVGESGSSREPKEDTGEPGRRRCLHECPLHTLIPQSTIRQWPGADSGTQRADRKPACSSRLQGGCRHLHQDNASHRKVLGRIEAETSGIWSKRIIHNQSHEWR